jgi:hypothetical protein
MPSTYSLISSNVLSSSAASVTFSAIPSTYTDLVLRISTRVNYASVDGNILIRFNGDTASNYSYTFIYGNGTTRVSSRGTSTTRIIGASATEGSSATSNTFASAELYIPSYLANQNKPVSLDSATENNATEAYRAANAGLWRNTAAITSIYLEGGDFVSGSSFYLYGIKNS